MLNQIPAYLLQNHFSPNNVHVLKTGLMDRNSCESRHVKLCSNIIFMTHNGMHYMY